MTGPKIPPGTPPVIWIAANCDDITSGGIVCLHWQAAKAIRDHTLDGILRDGLVRLRKLDGVGANFERRRSIAERIEAVIRKYNATRGAAT